MAERIMKRTPFDWLAYHLVGRLPTGPNSWGYRLTLWLLPYAANWAYPDYEPTP